MEFIEIIKRSALKLGRGLKHVKTHKDGNQTEEEAENKKITVGICVLEKKALSPPMTQVSHQSPQTTLRIFQKWSFWVFVHAQQ